MAVDGFRFVAASSPARRRRVGGAAALPFLLGAAALGATAGCSAIPAEPLPTGRLGAGAEPAPYHLTVAPVSLQLAAEEEPKGYRPGEVVDERSLRAALCAWLRAGGALQSVRSSETSDPEQVLDEAWEARDDLVLEVALRDFKTVFQGHNAWWIPNIINWVFWIVPSWFVATEEYVLSFTADAQVRSVDSRRVLYRTALDVSVEGTFDEFDRGWQVLGFIFPNNDAENWRRIAERLVPAARGALGEAVARAVEQDLRPHLLASATRKDMAKTLALVVGVSHYEDATRLPPLPFAGEDARAVAATLVAAEGCGVDRRHVTTIVGGEATRARLTAAVSELVERARPGDQVLVYLAGHGTRLADGRAALLLHDADSPTDALTLDELRALLEPVPGLQLVLIDASFDGSGRSIASGTPAPADPGADASALSGADRAAILATSPGGDLVVPEHVGGGLFTHYLLRGLRGAADLDQDGWIALEELAGFAGGRTSADAAVYGQQQAPVGAGLTSRFRLRGPKTGGSAAKGAP